VFYLPNKQFCLKNLLLASIITRQYKRLADPVGAAPTPDASEAEVLETSRPAADRGSKARLGTPNF